MALAKEEEGSENNAATNYFLYHSAFRFKSQEGGVYVYSLCKSLL